MEARKGTVFRIQREIGDVRYIILTRPVDRQRLLWDAFEFHLDMGVPDELPGWQYTPERVQVQRMLDNPRAGRLDDSQVENLDDFVKTSARIIAKHGSSWLKKEYWQGTPYWKD